mgnify:CR=1 FL=1
MAGMPLCRSSEGINAVLVVWALLGGFYSFGVVVYTVGIRGKVNGMVLYEIHFIEGNYTDPGSKVVLAEIL